MKKTLTYFLASILSVSMCFLPSSALETADALRQDKTISEINLEIPAVLAITRPSETLSTTYDKYFITGTSDPGKPVYFGDEEIQRIGTKGTFGVLVSLSMGDNSFTFTQGGQAKTVTIKRTAYASQSDARINEITQSSMIPAVFSGAKAGGELSAGCIAPAGANVKATFGGKTVMLTQVAETAYEGLPAFYKGVINISEEYNADVTENYGKVKYEMTYKGETKAYESTGNVYVAGKNSNIAVRVSSYMGFVYTNVGNLSIFREKLKRGATDYLRTQDNTYAELASGGYVAKEQLSVITGKVFASNKLQRVSFEKSSKGETFMFEGTNTPAYVTRLTDEKFSITFFNTAGSPIAPVTDSRLFSSVTAIKGSNYVTYTFTRKPDITVWGYNVAYKNNQTVLSVLYKPVLQSGSKPFEGITIAIDPGHGGTDGGANGVAGSTGPTETDVNLAHAYAIRDSLLKMGANVVLTRDTDEFFLLDDRLEFSEEIDADLFISVHHNSIGENTDANTIKGLEIYYHTELSKKLASSMMASLSTRLDRNERFVMQSYYRVTLSPYAPSILLELGYMSNPVEYERAASINEINKVAAAVADGIKQTLS